MTAICPLPESALHAGRHHATEPGMPDLFFEDMAADAELPSAELVVTEEDAAHFAETFAPGVQQPGSGPEHRHPLSQWHVAALGMRLFFDSVVARAASMGAPGIDEVTWPCPVYPGDRLRFKGRVTATRISASRPQMGLVTVAFALFNQHGSCVMTQDNVVMIETRKIEG